VGERTRGASRTSSRSESESAAVASESFVVSGAVASATPEASVTAEVPASPLSAFPVRASIASGTGSAGAPEDASGARGPSGTSGAPRTSPRCLGDARADVSRTRGARLGEAVFEASALRGTIVTVNSSRFRPSEESENRKRKEDDA
jgi:hypothetical protein